MIKYKPKPMKKAQFEALKQIRDYILVNEEAHWVEAGKPDTNHIYPLGKVMDDYIYSCEQFTNGDEEWGIDRADD